MQKEEVIGQIDGLIGAWCDRRELKVLRIILCPGYPTDNWRGVLNALREVRAFAKDGLTEEEEDIIEHLIIEIDRMLNPSSSSDPA